MKSQLTEELLALKEDIMSGVYGTKNRVELLLRIESLLKLTKGEQCVNSPNV